MTPLIELQNVSKSFGDQPVLRDISLRVHPRETVVIIGESGCGKSVTMKLMMGLLEPTRGVLLWKGRSLAERTTQEMSRERLHFGYLFQGAALFDSLDVYENVAFGLRQNTKLAENAIRQIVHERLQEVGLPVSVCRKKPAELSGGMKKRVGLARALAMNPEVMLYDEPTTGLDPIMSDVINELILRTRRARPVTSIVVSHSMRTARAVGDRVLMIHPLSRLEPDQRQIIFDGPPSGLDRCEDARVGQFVRGEAGERITEMQV